MGCSLRIAAATTMIATQKQFMTQGSTLNTSTDGHVKDEYCVLETDRDMGKDRASGGGKYTWYEACLNSSVTLRVCA